MNKHFSQSLAGVMRRLSAPEFLHLPQKGVIESHQLLVAVCELNDEKPISPN